MVFKKRREKKGRRKKKKRKRKRKAKKETFSSFKVRKILTSSIYGYILI